MKRVLLLLALGAAACAQRGRDVWQLPETVLSTLALKRTEVVADIGAGNGYFARRFARLAAKVYAVDIDARALEAAKKRAPENLVTVVAAPDDPKLAPGSVDTIFFCNSLHHIENRAAYYPKLARALKPGGRIVDIDYHNKPLPVGPPEPHKLAEEDVLKELEAAGFKLTARHDVLPYQYFLEFRR